jgi:hypothetical protein
VTKQEAKAMTLEVWGYLAEHPEIKEKRCLPDYLFNKIRHLVCGCPLCEVFESVGIGCFGCPLSVGGLCCASRGRSFSLWVRAENDQDRRAAAKEIVRLVEAWGW